MANSAALVTSLKVVFIALGCVMTATLIYTISIDGLPFRMDLLTPWLAATLLDYYINVVPLTAWACYKEANWLLAIIWVIFLVCLGSITTCVYIAFQLFKLSAEESTHDPMYYLLLRHENKNGTVRKEKSFQLLIARVVFGALGCLMLGTLVYTTTTHGSPFKKELLTPWMNATLVDFYINVVALSIWVGYKESSWIGAFLWILGLICLGSALTCAYIMLQFFKLSPSDPIYFVLLNNKPRLSSHQLEGNFVGSNA